MPKKSNCQLEMKEEEQATQSLPYILVSPPAYWYLPPLHFHLPLSLPNEQVASARSLIGVAMASIFTYLSFSPTASRPPTTTHQPYETHPTNTSATRQKPKSQIKMTTENVENPKSQEAKEMWGLSASRSRLRSLRRRFWSQKVFEGRNRSCGERWAGPGVPPRPPFGGAPCRPPRSQLARFFIPSRLTVYSEMPEAFLQF